MSYSVKNEELSRNILLYETPEKLPELSYVVNTDILPKGKVSYYPTNKKTKSLFLKKDSEEIK